MMSPLPSAVIRCRRFFRSTSGELLLRSGVVDADAPRERRSYDCTPGVTVALSNPGVIGGNQETVSDARGAYQFPGLVPGTYTVTATLVGFSTRVQAGIVVNADVTARADLELAVGALEETVTVTGETPLLDTASTLRQTVMPRELIDTLPARQDIWAMARTAPAVVMTKYDVGGSEMFAQTASVVHGSAFEERTHMIDGMEVTWGGGEGWAISYFDAHSFEEVNFQTSGGSAEYGKGGPVINMITRTGTNDFHGQNTGPSSHFIESNAMTSQRISSPLYQTKWTSVLGRNMLLEASGSVLTGEEHGRPVPGVQSGDLPTFDAVRLEHRGAVPSYLNRPATRVHLLSGLTFLAGAHDIKVGYQVQWRKHGDTHSSFISPYGINGVQNGIRAVFRDGMPDSVNTHNTPTTFEMFARDHAAYIQDRWRPTRKLTLNLGLRLEKLHAWQPSVCQQETLFIAAECFPAINGAPDFFAPSPRFGLIYDFAADGRTALKVTVNRYNQPIGVSHIRSYLNPVRRTNDTRTWTDANGDLFPQLDELGPSTGFNLGTTNRFADDLRWPAATEYSVGIEHQLPGELVLGATYIHRRRTNELGSRNVAIPISSYTPIDVTEAVTGRQVTVYNLDPALRGVFDVVYANEPEHDAVFNGVDVTFNKRMSNRWMLMGGLSLGDTAGDIYGAGAALNNPNYQFRRGVNTYDIPVSFKAFGLYELPYQLQLSASAQHFTGFPEVTTVRVSGNTVALTQVAQTLTVEPRGTTRRESVNMVDISLRRSFVNGRYQVTPVLDVFNLFNNAAIAARVTTLGSAYQRVRDIQRGRLVKFGLNVDF